MTSASKLMKLEKGQIAFVSALLTHGFVYLVSALWVGICFFVSDATSSFLLVAGFSIWILGTIISLLILIIGAIIFFKYGRFFNYFILIHLIMLCISFVVMNIEFCFAIFKISFGIGHSGISVGLNIIALPFLVLYVIMSWRYILKEKMTCEYEYTCSKCGKEVALENRFCPHWGEDIREVEENHD